MRIAAPTLVGLIVLVLVACRGPSGGSDGASGLPPAGSTAIAGSTWLESGASLYMQYCASCHGPTAQGNGPAAESLRKAPSDLTQLFRRYGQPLPKERLAAVIDGRAEIPAHGSREMPVWGQQLYAGDRPDTPARDAARSGTILLILEYLETQQRPETPAQTR